MAGKSYEILMYKREFYEGDESSMLSKNRGKSFSLIKKKKKKKKFNKLIKKKLKNKA